MDLTFRTEYGKFNFRVGAVIIKDNKVLVVKNENAPYYYSVGGRVKFGESCEQAVMREVKEELGITLEILRPAFFHESFFDEVVTGEHYHEVCMYYLMKPPLDISKIRCFSVTDNGSKESLEWLPIQELDNYCVFPEFFKKELLNLTQNIRCIVDK